jgi:hypothetical protein
VRVLKDATPYERVNVVIGTLLGVLAGAANQGLRKEESGAVVMALFARIVAIGDAPDTDLAIQDMADETKRVARDIDREQARRDFYSLMDQTEGQEIFKTVTTH